jgi:hypothetical protein
MNSDTRANVAYIVASLCGASRGYVYDFSTSKYKNISGSVDINHVNIYDNDRGCHVTGSSRSLYDYGVGSHIQLNLNGTRFNGFDYNTGNHFSGNINGKNISIYDYETSSYHNYSV